MRKKITLALMLMGLLIILGGCLGVKVLHVFIAPKQLTIQVGKMGKFVGSASYTDGWGEYLIKAEWESSNPAVATVNEWGEVFAISEGTTQITFRRGDKTAAATVTVKAGTLDPSGIIISSVEFTDLESDRAELHWTTNLPGKIAVKYGEDENLGQTVSEDTLAEKHVITLTGLKAGTLYHYQVTATAADGEKRVLEEQAFITKSSTSFVLPARFNLIEYQPTTNKLYCLSKEKCQLLIFDLATRQIEKTIPLTHEPDRFCIALDRAKAYISNTDSCTISEVDLILGKVTRNIPWPGIDIKPFNVYTYPIYYGHRLIYGIGSGNVLWTIDPDNLTVKSYALAIPRVCWVTVAQQSPSIYCTTLDGILQRYTIEETGLVLVDQSNYIPDFAVSNIALREAKDLVYISNMILDSTNLKNVKGQIETNYVNKIHPWLPIGINNDSLVNLDSGSILGSLPTYVYPIFFGNDGNLYFGNGGNITCISIK